MPEAAQSPEHKKFMARALFLAAKGRGRVEPNPQVGAVVVKDGEILGEGWHERYGGPHAEANALANCRKSPRGATAASGATLYVNLEPCCHHGKTPPCTDAILASGIAHVVYANDDPNPHHERGGAQKLRDAGVTVTGGVLAHSGAELNAAYFKLVKTGKPYVIAKWAMTLDGKIATRSGDSRWISSDEALDFAHQLRHESGAVLIGLGTALADNPLLTVRRVEGGRNPLRVVLDSEAKLPPASNLAQTARETPVLVAVGERADAGAIARLRGAGCEVIALPAENGAIRLDALLDELGKRSISRLLIEGGSRVLGSAFDQRTVDEVVVVVAGKIVGGQQALSPVGGLGLATVGAAFQTRDLSVQELGNDLVIRARVVYPGGATA